MSGKCAIIAVHGPSKGKRYEIDSPYITFGRKSDSTIILNSKLASRIHAEVRRVGNDYVLYDRGSSNGCRVNGTRVSEHWLQPGDALELGDEVFRFELSDVLAYNTTGVTAGPSAASPVLRVAVSGGGPTGLAFALYLAELLGSRVAIKVFDGRWKQEGDRVVWKNAAEGNSRRQQVVTLQSRQFSVLPLEVQERLFTPGAYSEMWPAGPDSVDGLAPRNIRIAHVEDQLLDLANEKADRIQLIPERFDPESAHKDLVQQHVLVICEGVRSRTREYFAAKFGAGDASPYSLEGQQVQDVVLGLRVKSELPDPMAVLLTVAQNRFLLNSLRGEGFLNMRLTDQEAREAIGIDPFRQIFAECIQSRPCVMEKQANGEFRCATHGMFFLPALLKESGVWARVLEGLKLFGVTEENLTAVTTFRLSMEQRPRFTAQIFAPTATTPGTYACLIGDAANAIHFWPGRGLNSGLSSAISLARCLAGQWRGTGLRDADFTRHEAVMGMLQYRHKSRAWRAMVTTDAEGNAQAIKDTIAQGITEGEEGAYDRAADLTLLMARLRQIRQRLAPRLDGLPDDATLQAHLDQLSSETLHTLAVSGAWDTVNAGGEEVDLDLLLPAPEAKTVPALA